MLKCRATSAALSRWRRTWHGRWRIDVVALEVAADGSIFRASVYATLPLLSETIKPWLPAGLPIVLLG